MTWLIVWSSLLFALGLILGTWAGYGRGRDQGYGEYEEELGRLQRGGTITPHRPTDLPCGCPRGMRYHALNCPEFPDQLQRPAEVAHEDDDWQAEELASEWHDHASLKWDDEGVPGCPSCERRWEVPYAWPAWSLLNADPPTLGEDIQAMIANANAVPSVRWLDRLEES